MAARIDRAKLPTPSSRPRLLFLLLCAAACVFPAPLAAQSFDTAQVRQPTDLTAARWLFHQGDDPTWSTPQLDDSSWMLVDPSQRLDSYAKYADLQHNHVFWYRLHLQLDGAFPDPAIKISTLARAYTVYANGQLLVRLGGAPGHEFQSYSPTSVYALPAKAGQPATVVLALRCVLLGNARSLDAPLLAPGKIVFGTKTELNENHRLAILSGDSPYWVLLLLEMTVGMLALALYWKQRTQRDYFWIAMLALQQLAQSLLNSGVDFVPLSRDFVQIGDAFLDSALMLFYMGFYSALMHRPRSLWTWMIWGSAALNLCLETVNSETAWLPGSVATILFVVCWSPLTIYPLILMAGTLRRREQESLLMLVPFAALSLEFNARFLSQILVGLGVLHRMPAFFVGIDVLYLRVSSTLCVNALFWLTIPAIIVFRSNRLSEANARIESELEAARQVQQMLLPDPSARVPGFDYESVYLPASQVGGDFFQLLPTKAAGLPDGGLLVVVGDVSGKGLPAAMLVSVLVGAIRTEAAHETDPGILLAALNQTLLGQVCGGGFTTCLCARIAANGEMTIANAGHLSPYLNGKEVDLPGALPLGLVPGVAYDTASIQLKLGNRLTFYSDGVPEAQNQAATMLGFDRARELSTRPAEEIASIAREFGQTDDITVLAVTWTGSNAISSKPNAA